MEEIDSFPLFWPVGYKRTHSRSFSQFKQTMEQAQRFLRAELSRLGATNIIVSTNIPVRKDGGLYAEWMKRKIDDPGVAIYFKYQDQDVAMCCDKYARIWENIYALGKSIEAIRGMERWGVSDFLERAFTGFTALPEKSSATIKTCWEILDIPKGSSGDVIRRAYHEKAKDTHPDKGGTSEQFNELAEAYRQAMHA